MTAERFDRYKCDDCNEVHEFKPEAQSCCNEPFYACRSCKRTYDDKWEAEECCENYTAVDRYRCSGCGDVYVTEQEANNCSCNDEE